MARSRSKAIATTEPAEAGNGTRGFGEAASSPEAPPTLKQIRQSCLMNMDYHASREAWLDQIHRWLMFSVIAAGAAAFADALKIMKIVGPIIAVIGGSLDLTFDLSNRARAHAMFRRGYADILAEASRSPDNLAALQARLDELSGEEEPPYNALLALCAARAEKMVHGDIQHQPKVGFFTKLLRNTLHYPGRDFYA